MDKNEENYVPKHAADKTNKIKWVSSPRSSTLWVWIVLAIPMVSLIISQLVVSNTDLGKITFAVVMLVIFGILLSD